MAYDARPFADRRDAGRRLALALTRFGRPDVIVLALPRGGVPVAFEVARTLRAPLDIFLVRKLGVPGTRSSLSVPSRRAASGYSIPT